MFGAATKEKEAAKTFVPGLQDTRMSLWCPCGLLSLAPTVTLQHRVV